MLDVSYVLKDINQREDKVFNWILEAIRLALAPFPTGKITMWIGESTDFISFDASRTLVIKCALLPRLPFAFEIKDRREYCCEEEVAQEIADAAYDWFFCRHIQPIDDHIILGED